MKRLNKIIFQFPNNNDKENDFYNKIIDILEVLPNARKVNNKVILYSSLPPKALPVTIFEINDKLLYPRLVLDLEEEINITMDNFIITSNKSFKKEYVKNKSDLKNIVPMSIETFFNKFKKHIIRIDHTGINIPAKYITKNNFLKTSKKISKTCNLYKYPTNDVWPFILPADKNEFENDIEKFKFGRGPKFEFVYDTYLNYPTIQIDLETNITRKQVEKLLPSPYGVSFENLADFFRTVYLKNPWPGLLMRIDVRFKNKTKELDSDWETGKWLVKSGKRI
jgi:hypothetical protein